MQDDYIDVIEEAPEIKSKKCKVISLIIKLSLQYSTYAIALITWYLYDYFIAIAVLLLTFIITGIVRSKITHSVIPPHQREYQYSDEEIANWLTVREICIGGEL